MNHHHHESPYGLERTISNTGSALSDTSSLTSTSTVWRIQERVPSNPETISGDNGNGRQHQRQHDGSGVGVQGLALPSSPDKLARVSSSIPSVTSTDGNGNGNGRSSGLWSANHYSSKLSSSSSNNNRQQRQLHRHSLREGMLGSGDALSSRASQSEVGSFSSRGSSPSGSLVS